MAKHRCKILHCVARSNLSKTILRQINPYIYSPGINHQGKSLHVHYGLALDMNENREISVFVCIFNMHYKFTSVQPETFCVRNLRFETCTSI